MTDWRDDAVSWWRLQAMVGDDRRDAELVRLLAAESYAKRDAARTKTVDTRNDDPR